MNLVKIVQNENCNSVYHAVGGGRGAVYISFIEFNIFGILIWYITTTNSPHFKFSLQKAIEETDYSQAIFRVLFIRDWLQGCRLPTLKEAGSA